jgi:hypothetical protein
MVSYLFLLGTPQPRGLGVGGIINLYIFKNFKIFLKFTINNCDKC